VHVRIRNHIRSHAVGYVAIFLFAMSGTATALTGSNTVFSDDIVNGEVKSQDIGNNQVRSVDVADDSTAFALTGADVADGSLSGQEIAGNTLTGDDVNESTLGQVPSALLGGFGRTGAQTACDPESTTFEACAATQILAVPLGARALILARVRATGEVDADQGSGACRLSTSSIGPVANTTTDFFVHDDVNFVENATLVGITPPLPAGATSFGVDCNQQGSGAVDYDDVSASVVLISAS